MAREDEKVEYLSSVIKTQREFTKKIIVERNELLRRVDELESLNINLRNQLDYDDKPHKVKRKSQRKKSDKLLQKQRVAR